MRKLYNYQVIRYYPNISSDEFFNVGIYLTSDEQKSISFIRDEHLQKLLVLPTIEKKYLKNYIKALKEEKNIYHWYGNYLKFSETRILRSDEVFEVVLEQLYMDCIGYKFIGG